MKTTKQKFVTLLEAIQVLKNDQSKQIFCKIKNVEYEVGYINTNNSTFSAERKSSSRPYNFEQFDNINNSFYTK